MLARATYLPHPDTTCLANAGSSLSMLELQLEREVVQTLDVLVETTSEGAGAGRGARSALCDMRNVRDGTVMDGFGVAGGPGTTRMFVGCLSIQSASCGRIRKCMSLLVHLCQLTRPYLLLSVSKHQ